MPRPSHRADATRSTSLSQRSPLKSPVKLPLNDDREEKSVRFKSRQALHEMQVNSIRMAASPAKRRSLGGAGSPHTPRNGEDKENDDDYSAVAGNAVTPMKRVPILANFEEWMKMATDNKINANNSWNFALIDYFHDMSLLREGDSVNFQKASCTLDGCVKIYTSRVDSVATETGKLLSGLADSNSKKAAREEGDGVDEDGDEDDEGEDGQKKPKKRRAKTAEATLATSFAQLQLKKMDLEFAVDPLFKKATADFDEGGAKGLLLNHLAIDATGRIVFDSSTDDVDTSKSESPATDEDDDAEDRSQNDKSLIEEDRPAEPESELPAIDIDSLASRFFPDLDKLDAQDICPSLKTYELGGADSSLDIPFLKDDDWKRDADKHEFNADNDAQLDDAPAAFGDDDDDAGLGGFDVPAEVGFGEGGEAWAKEAALETQPRPFDAGLHGSADDVNDADDGHVGGYDPDSAHYGLTLGSGRDDTENILTYFDNALQKNWAGPQHWRIQKVKDATSAKTAAPTRQRKEKEPFTIDFSAPMSRELAGALYTPANTNSSIQLPRSQWKSKSRNLLPDDKHFNSKQLLRLFLKPKARIGARRPGGASRPVPQAAAEDPQQAEMDPAFWARRAEEAAAEDAAAIDNSGPMQGDYDANFFQDDGLSALPSGIDDDDDEVFADARDHFSPGADGLHGAQVQSLDAMLAPDSQAAEGGFGSQLVTSSRRVRPEYVQYARVAKKVDVRRLKEEIWKELRYEKEAEESHSQQHKMPEAPALPTQEDGTLRFTDAMKGLQSVYPSQQMADISTSYCFICLLHLANEKGLVLQHESNWEEIRIRRDDTAEILDGAD